MSMPKKFRAVLRYTSTLNMDNFAAGFPTKSWKTLAGKPATPIYVIPATPEAYSAMVEAASKAMWESGPSICGWFALDQSFRNGKLHQMRAALAAIGIHRPTKGHK